MPQWAHAEASLPPETSHTTDSIVENRAYSGCWEGSEDGIRGRESKRDSRSRRVEEASHEHVEEVREGNGEGGGKGSREKAKGETREQSGDK